MIGLGGFGACGLGFRVLVLGAGHAAAVRVTSVENASFTTVG